MRIESGDVSNSDALFPLASATISTLVPPPSLKSADVVYGRPLYDFQATRGGASGTQGVAVFLLFLHHLLLLARD